MSHQPSLPARLNEDGSVDVWVHSWRIHFAIDGPPEHFESDAAPSGLSGTVEGLKQEYFERTHSLGIRWGGWIAVIGEGAPRYVPEKPKPPPAVAYRLYRRRGI